MHKCTSAHEMMFHFNEHEISDINLLLNASTYAHLLSITFHAKKSGQLDLCSRLIAHQFTKFVIAAMRIWWQSFFIYLYKKLAYRN